MIKGVLFLWDFVCKFTCTFKYRHKYVTQELIKALEGQRENGRKEFI